MLTPSVLRADWRIGQEGLANLPFGMQTFTSFLFPTFCLIFTPTDVPKSFLVQHFQRENSLSTSREVGVVEIPLSLKDTPAHAPCLLFAVPPTPPPQWSLFLQASVVGAALLLTGLPTAGSSASSRGFYKVSYSLYFCILPSKILFAFLLCQHLLSGFLPFWVVPFLLIFEGLWWRA